MSNFSAYKQRVSRSAVFKPQQQELDRVPRQFCEYMNEENNRFSEICRVYLEGLSMDDVKYLKAEDLIALVPHDHHKHKLLMTIMVRRYLYRPDESDTVYCKPLKTDNYERLDTMNNFSDHRSVDSRDSRDSCDSQEERNNSRSNDKTKCVPIHHPKPEYSCDNCDHVCTNVECDHSCEDYTKIVRQN